MFKKLFFVCLSSLFVLGACKGEKTIVEKNEKKALMWFDATANFERFSNPDSIDYYLTKIKELGFTHAVVDVRPISGEVLFSSNIAPELKEWNGYERGDMDYLGHFIKKGHELGIEIHASLNTFVAGHNFFDRGVIYDNHPEWATQVYRSSGEIVPITAEKHKYSAMVNPINKEYREYFIALLGELIAKYPELDGIMLDRVRYDGITADFSTISKEAFEYYIGEKVENFPSDIFKWKENDEGKAFIERGKYFKQWIEWRSQTITDFMAMARGAVKTMKPDMVFGAYTGAWYPSYYEVGVNFASSQYDPSQDFDWATDTYKNTGYAELMDLYTVGNYYHDVSIEDYEQTNKVVVNETDLHGHTGVWYCVEGSCKKLRTILRDNPFIGGILADQFYDKPEDLARSIEMNIKESDGVMIFDIVHIIHKGMWNEVKEGMEKSGMIK